MLLSHWLQGLFPNFRFPNFQRRRRFAKRRRVLGSLRGSVGIVYQSEQLEDRTLLSTFYVDDSFTGAAGQDPDGPGPATSLGGDSFNSLQSAISAASDGDTILIAPGTYSENLFISKDLALIGQTGQAGDVQVTPSSGIGMTISGSSSVSISSLTIDTVNAAGISYSANSGASSLTLSNVIGDGAGTDGLSITANNNATASVILTDVSFNNAGSNAINISSLGQATVSLTGNRVSGAHAGADGIHLVATNGGISVDLDNVGSFAGAGDDGIEILASGGSGPLVSVDVSGKSGARGDFTGAADNGVTMSLTNYQGYDANQRTFDFNQLDFSDAGSNAFHINSKGQGGSTSTFNGLVTNSAFDNAGLNGLQATLSGNTPLSELRFENTTMRNAGQDAVNVVTMNQTTFGLDIIDGDLTGSGRDNININQDHGSQVDLFVDPTNLDHGFTFSGDNGTVLNAHVLDTPLSSQSDSSPYGVFGTLTGGATMNLIVENSDTRYADFDGMNVSASQGSTFNATFIKSVLYSSTQRGAIITLDNSTANISFKQNSVITRSGSSNFQLNAINGSTANLNWDASSSNLNGLAGTTTVDGLNLQASGANSLITASFAGPLTINNAGRYGMALTATNGGSIAVDANQGLTIRNAGDRAIQINANNGTVSLDADNVALKSINDGIAISGSAGSNIDVSLTNVTSIESAAGDALNYTLNQSTLDLVLTGTSSVNAELDGLGGSGIDGFAQGNSSVEMVVRYFLIDGVRDDGIRLTFDDATLTNSVIRDGIIRNSGQGGANFAGISLRALDGASIGNAMTGEHGLTMTYLTLENSGADNAGGSQTTGLKAISDEGAYLKARLTNSLIRNQNGDGIQVSSNANNTANDSAFVDLFVGTTDILHNRGDGVRLVAKKGMVGSTGIAFTVAGNSSDPALISGNGNGSIGDGIGDGIDARALGDGNPGSAAIALNLKYADVSGNEEQQLNLIANGGGVINQELTGGTYGAVVISADGIGSTASLVLNKVKLLPDANRAGIVMYATNGGLATGSFKNMSLANGTEVADFGAQGFVFLAEFGGDIQANFTNVDFLRNAFNSGATAMPADPTSLVDDRVNSLGVHGGIQGLVNSVNPSDSSDPSTANVNFTNVTVQDSGNYGAGHFVNGVDLEVTNGGHLTSHISKMTLLRNSANNEGSTGGGQEEGDLDLLAISPGTKATLDISNLTVAGSTGEGVRISAANNALLSLPQFDNVTASKTSRGGLEMRVSTGASLVGDTVNITNSNFNNSPRFGARMNIDTTAATGPVNVNLQNVTASGSAGHGVDIAMTGTAGKGSNITLDNVDANNVASRGLNVSVNGMANTEVTHIDVINGSQFNNSGLVGVTIDVQSNSPVGTSRGIVHLTDLEANGALGGRGIGVTFGRGVRAQNVTVDNVSATGARSGGLYIGTDTGNNTRLQNIIITDSNFDNAGTTGVQIAAGTQSTGSNIEMTNVTANGADARGVWVNLQGAGGANSIHLHNVDATNVTGVRGLDINLFGLTSSTEIQIDQGSDFSGVNNGSGGGDGINIIITGNAGATATVDLNDVTADNAGRGGIKLSVAGSVATPNVNFTDVSAQGALGGQGLDLDITDLITTGNNINLTRTNFSGAGGDGVNVHLTGTVAATATMAINDLGISNSTGGDGFDFSLDGGLTATVSQFDLVSADNNSQNGLKFLVTGGSTLTNFVATALTLADNGLGGNTFDSIDVIVDGVGSNAAFDFSGLVITNSTEDEDNNTSTPETNIKGRGIDLDVINSGDLTFNITGTGNSISDTGLQAIDINVGVSDETLQPVFAAGTGTFSGNFSNLTITGAGRFPTNTADGINLDVRGVGSVAGNILNPLTFTNVASNGGDADGFDFSFKSGTLGNVNVTGGSTATGNAGRGLGLAIDGLGTDVTFSSTPVADVVNTFNGNGSHGMDVNVTNAATATFPNLAATANGNLGGGVRLIANDGTGVSLPGGLGINATNVNIDGNAGAGLTIDLKAVILTPDSSSEINLDLSGMTVTNNVGDQINVRIVNAVNPFNNINFSDITATGPGTYTSTGTGDGIQLTLDNTNVTDSLSLDRINASGNDEDGLQLNLRNGASIPANSVIDVGTYDDNGRYGVNVSLNNSASTLNFTNSTFANQNTIASKSGNGIAGINIDLQNASTLTTDIDRQTVNANGMNPGARSFNNRGGILVNTGGTSVFNSGNSITNNTVTDNIGFGFRGVFLGGTFNLSFGKTDNGNILEGNRDAGIGIDMIQNTIGAIRIVDNVISGTVNGTDANFDGEGIKLRMIGTGVGSPATNTLVDAMAGPGLLIQGNDIGINALGSDDGNASFGVTFDVREQSKITGLNILDNRVSNNGNGGIEFRRRDFVEINGFLIDGNMIQRNVGNGIGLFGQNSGTDVMNIIIGADSDSDGVDRSDIVNWIDTLDGNVISNNTFNGIQLYVQADSQLQVDMNENTIRDNNNDGILMTETALSSDSRSITGDWDQNVISNNGNIGIQSNANTYRFTNIGAFDGIDVTDGFVGAVLDPFGNILYDGNESTGVELNGAGEWNFLEQDILLNGRSVTGNRAIGHGIDIQGVGKEVTITDTVIQRNFQDGLEIRAANGFGMDVGVYDTRINDNVGRGIDVLTQWESRTFLTVEGSVDPRSSDGLDASASVSSNGEEGIYIVNTPSTTQDQSDFSWVALDQNGADANVTPRTNALISGVDMSFNGNDVGHEGDSLRPAGSGLVVRVGSSDGRGNVTNDDGGFASTASSGSTPSGRNSSRGGVVMRVDTNYFNGNTGDGMFVHGYRATAPSGTGTTWGDTGTINNTGYDSDPLARFDLIWGVETNFDENVFEGGDVANFNNNNTFSGGSGTPDHQYGAFYQTDDSDFKSRISSSQTYPNNPGPFGTNDDRRRNAQRQGARVYDDGTDLGPATNPNLLYPGMGMSTFRVQATTGDNQDLLDDGYYQFGVNGFAFDNPNVFLNADPFGPSDITGINFTAPQNGELPFGWGMF